MSDISDCIVKILADNGVSVKQTDIWKDNGSIINVKNIIELDFSEHDKVFGDRIVELKKVYKTASELLGTYQQENEALEKRIQELDAIDAMRIDENKELRQRITELESKETSDLPFDPLECANYLINSTYERETNVFERSFTNLPDKVNDDRYTIDELEQIAEHLLVYCKHNKESE